MTPAAKAPAAEPATVTPAAKAPAAVPTTVTPAAKAPAKKRKSAAVEVFAGTELGNLHYNCIHLLTY